LLNLILANAVVEGWEDWPVFTFWALLAALVGVLLVTVWRNRRRGRPWWK
jgi:hypothetical protein